MGSEQVWYFGFGSNMNTSIFTGRRNIHPKTSIPGKLKGYKLVFDLPALPYIEPGMGNLIKADGEVHGVLHLITLKDFETIQATEGGGGNDNIGYQKIEVNCEDYQNNKIIAYTLHGENKPNRRDLKPSRRYLNLLIEGAQQHDLDSDYINYLIGLEAYKPSSWKSYTAKYLLFVFGIVFVFPVYFAVFSMLKFGIKPPKIFHVLMNHIKDVVWYVHDNILSVILESTY